MSDITPQTKFIGVRMPLDLVEKMEVVLTHDSTGWTEYIRGLVRDDLRKRGLLTPAPQPETTAA